MIIDSYHILVIANNIVIYYSTYCIHLLRPRTFDILLLKFRLSDDLMFPPVGSKDLHNIQNLHKVVVSY